jgi:phage head maturation protease
MSAEHIFKSYSVEFKKTADKEVTGYITTTDIDHVGDVVLPEGIDVKSRFQRGVVYFNHNKDMPVGKNRTLDHTKRGIVATTTLLDTVAGSDMLKFIEAGIIGGFSIGFLADEMGSPSSEEVDKFRQGEKVPRRIIRRATLLEYSIVIDPCNEACELFDKAMALVKSAKVQASTFGRLGLVAPKRVPPFIDDEGRIWYKPQ